MIKVVTPPYDIISLRDQERYYKLSPYNIVRLVLGEEYEGDNETDNKYTRAAAFLYSWQRKGVLKRLRQLALYVYSFTFKRNNRQTQVLGLVSLVRLAKFGTGKVLPHEKTFAGPKADRLKLIKACRAHLDQVFSVYSDESGEIKKLLVEEHAAKEPLISVRDEEGVLHQIRPVTNRSIINRINDLLVKKQLFIADGHHRYETALSYAAWRRSQEDDPADNADYNFIPMLLIDIANEALDILPTHRLVTHLANISKADFRRRLEKFFKIASEPNIAQLIESMSRLIDDHAFGLYLGNQEFYLLTLIDKVALDKYMPAQSSDDWKNLDAAILQYLVLEEILGVKNQGQGKPAEIGFTESKDEAIAAVDKGSASLALFLNPTKIEQVQTVARNNEKMPQKSTYFYPKPLTGLIMNLID